MSREGPPSLGALILATQSLDELFRLTTSGRYRIQIIEPADIDDDFSEPYPPTSAELSVAAKRFFDDR